MIRLHISIIDEVLKRYDEGASLNYLVGFLHDTLSDRGVELLYQECKVVVRGITEVILENRINNGAGFYTFSYGNPDKYTYNTLDQDDEMISLRYKYRRGKGD